MGIGAFIGTGRGRDVCIGRGGRDKASGCEAERSIP
jgi:hypothetical protein